MPSKGHIQVVNRKGIVYSISPFGIVRSKHPKIFDRSPGESDRSPSFCPPQEISPNKGNLPGGDYHNAGCRVPIFFLDPSYTSPFAMPGSWGDEDEHDEASYDRVRADGTDGDDGGQGRWHGLSDPTPGITQKDAGAHHKQRNNSKPPAERRQPSNMHPRSRPDTHLSASHHNNSGPAPVGFSAVHGDAPLPHFATTTSPLPFCTAARKLQITLIRSLEFFKRFYREFQKETRALGAYADIELINRAWQKKVRNSEQYLTPWSNGSRGSGTRKGQSGSPATEANSASDANNDNDNGGNNNQHPWRTAAQEGSLFTATAPDLRTFLELQREVIERVTAMYHAKLPKSRLHAPTDKHTLSSYPSNPLHYSPDDDGGSGSGPDDRHIMEQWNLALNLKRHVQDSYGQVIRAVRVMDKDYMAVTTAARELEMLKRDLEIYQRGWDDAWRNNEDDGYGDDGRGDGADVEETAAESGFS